MFSIVWKTITQLMQNRLKFFLTVGGIAVGVMSVIVIYSAGETGKKEIDDMLSGMGMNCIILSGEVSNTDGLDESDLDSIRNMDNVDNAMPLMNTITYCKTDDLQDSVECMLWGVNEEADNVIDLDVKYGRMINKGDVAVKADVCIIDSALAEKLYNREDITGKAIGIVMNNHVRYYTVVGIVDNGVSMLQSMFGGVIPSFIYIPYTSMQNDTAQYCFNQIAVRTNDGNSDIEQDIKRVVSAEHDFKSDIEVSSFLSRKDTLSDIMNVITIVLAAIAAISLIVSGISVMNIMLVSVNERIREIGIKKSLGAKNIDIALEFLAESVAITFTGGIMGVLAGVIMVIIGGKIMGMKVLLNINFLIFALIFSVATGIIFGVYPACKAGRMNPVDALRG
ncbi:MAG: ABC transporter permease [Oscillospiraceae bacterium]